jgi:hypothetical protein
VRIIAVLGVLVGCGAPELPAAPAPLAPSADPGWIPTLMADPARFDALIADDRDGWVELHRGGWPRVSPGSAGGAGPPGPAARRLALRRAALSRALLRVSTEAWRQWAAGWARRGDPALLSGVEAAAAAAAADAEAAAAGLPAARVRPPGPLADCHAAHLAARSAGQLPSEGGPCAALASASPPLPDPFLPATLVVLHPIPDLGGLDPLAQVALSARWARADEGPSGALAADLGLQLAAAADLQAVRDQVHALDAALEERAAGWAAAAGPGGVELERDLQLVGLWRAEALRVGAEDLLAAGRPAEASAALMLAFDATQTRTVSPRSSAALRLAMAEAALRTGRAREALDALTPLRDGWPEVLPVIELINDLVVLDSLGEVGQSSE